jgi:hypothetical protein
MSKLTVYKHREDLQQQQPEGQRAPQPSFSSIDPVVIAATLAEKGIGFERWPAPVNLSSNAEAEEILRAYGPEIARVHAHDVIFIGPAGHEFVDVTELQRIIKSCFSVVGMAVVCEIGFGRSHGESLSLPQVIDTAAIKKPA